VSLLAIQTLGLHHGDGDECRINLRNPK